MQLFAKFKKILRRGFRATFNFRKHHIDQVASKISKMTGIMAKARHYLSLKTLQTIFDTMVYPYLTYMYMYCNIIWRSTYQSSLKSLFMLQKRLLEL